MVKTSFQVRCSAELKSLIKQIQSEGIKRGKILSEKEILDIIAKEFKNKKGVSLL